MDIARPSIELGREALAFFERLLELSSPDREEELGRLAESRPDLHSQVLGLLKADQLADVSGFLGADAVMDASSYDSDADKLKTGMRFGAYELDRQLGSGGMGDVWLARRFDGRFEGLVAVKVLHAHVAQRAARERFLREVRILAQLSHPNIARLLDAGATETGVLYFVLEYIEGEPVDRWCDARALGISSRLAVFRQICAAVAYLHTQLVVHRDLKPANILVTPQGQVKLLDFGVAKLLEAGQPGEETELTQLGGRALTPDYAAPEQILGAPISTATDVHALGVLLYLLLSGRKPYQRQQMTFRELEHDVLSNDAAPLSVTVPADEDSQRVADRRGLTTQKLKRALAGDLQNIVGKAMRKEPERRYANVEQLAADVQRYLEGRPVLAAPDTWAYRTGKFVRRHALSLGATVGSVLLLAAFAVAMYLQAERTKRERLRAETVSNFLVGLFELPDPYEGRGNEITARQLLGIGVQRLDADFAEQSGTRATMTATIGRVYNRLGLSAEARPLLENALADLLETSGPESGEIAATLNELGNVLAALGEFDDAETRLREALGMRRKLFGDDSLEAAETLMDLGRLALERGQPVVAEKLLRESLTAYTRQGKAATSAAANVMNELAAVLGFVGRISEAATLLEEALAIDRPAHGQDHPRVIMETHNLAVMLQRLDRLAEAEPLMRDSIARMRRVLGAEHPYTIDALANYGRFLRKTGAMQEAEQVMREVLDLNLRLRSELPIVLNSYVNLATLMHDSGRLAEAEQQFRAGLSWGAEVVPRDHPFRASALSGLGRVLVDDARAAEAIPLLRQAVAIASASMPADSPLSAAVRCSLASGLLAMGKRDEAKELMRNSYDIVIKTQDARTALVRQVREAMSTLELVTAPAP